MEPFFLRQTQELERPCSLVGEIVARCFQGMQDTKILNGHGGLARQQRIWNAVIWTFECSISGQASLPLSVHVEMENDYQLAVPWFLFTSYELSSWLL